MTGVTARASRRRPRRGLGGPGGAAGAEPRWRRRRAPGRRLSGGAPQGGAPQARQPPQQQVPPQGQRAAARRRLARGASRASMSERAGCGSRRCWRWTQVTRRLRRECPWDREQDERSIVPHTVEEAYELADAAHAGDDAKLLDELGDVLFQVYFLALLLEERGTGDLAAVARGVTREAGPPPSARVRRGRTSSLEACRPRRRDAGRGARELGRDQARARRRGDRCRRAARPCPRCCMPRKVQRKRRGDRRARASLRARARAIAVRRGEDDCARIDDPRLARSSTTRIGELLLAAVELARRSQVDPEVALRLAATAGRSRA